MRCITFGAWALLGMLGCGAEPPVTKAPAAVTVVSQEPDVAPEPEAASIVDLVDRDADVFVYFDAKTFRQGSLYAAIMHVVNAVAVARAELAELTQKCGFNPVEALSEVAFSAQAEAERRDLDMDSALLVARSTQSPESSLACIAGLMSELEPAEVEGHPALTTSGGYIVAAEPFLVVGEPGPVRRALERLRGGARDRIPPGYLYAELESQKMFDAERIEIGVGQGPRGTEFEVHARATSVERAQQMERSVLDLKREGLEELQEEEDVPGAAKNLVTELVESVRFERRGADLMGAFSFGSPEREAQVLGIATALVVEGIDKYLRSRQISEAITVVSWIGSSLNEYAVKQKPPRFPKSAPMVPQQVPAASSYQSSEADWQQAGWKELGFTWDRPQHYAFSFETAPGGRKVTVRALGDRDGDGVLAKFELDLEIRQGQVIRDDEMRQENPDE